MLPISISCLQPLADTTPRGFLQATALPNPCCLHSALGNANTHREWKYTQGGKRIRRGVAPPKRNLSKTGETQDLGSSIVLWDKRWGWQGQWGNSDQTRQQEIAKVTDVLANTWNKGNSLLLVNKGNFWDNNRRAWEPSCRKGNRKKMKRWRSLKTTG